MFCCRVVVGVVGGGAGAESGAGEVDGRRASAVDGRGGARQTAEGRGRTSGTADAARRRTPVGTRQRPAASRTRQVRALAVNSCIAAISTDRLSVTRRTAGPA